MRLSPLHRIGLFLLFAMLIATVVHWIGQPVRRDCIEPMDLNFRINVNTADVNNLSLLSGISGKISEYLIEERQTHGPFTQPEDLDRVRWIGPVTIRKIAPYVTFESPAKAD